MIGVSNFYNYVYLDPRKPGKFSYEGLPFSFLYEPFYVGKGSKSRFKQHLNLNTRSNKHNNHKSNKIQKIMNDNYNMLDYIMIINQQVDDNATYMFEEFLIRTIGRVYDKKGPLTNKDFGGRKGKGNNWSKSNDREILHVSNPTKIIKVYSIAEFARSINCCTPLLSRLFSNKILHAAGWVLTKNEHLLYTIIHPENVKLPYFILEKDNIEYKIRTLEEIPVKDTTNIRWLLSGFGSKINGFTLSQKNENYLLFPEGTFNIIENMIKELLLYNKPTTTVEVIRYIRESDALPNDVLSCLRKYKVYKDITTIYKPIDPFNKTMITMYYFNYILKKVCDVTFEYGNWSLYFSKVSGIKNLLSGKCKRVDKWYLDRQLCEHEHRIIHLENIENKSIINVQYIQGSTQIGPDFCRLVNGSKKTYNGYKMVNLSN